MAFRIRRGTDTERLSITPKEGELLYVTDNGNIYVGDGSTTGGNLVKSSVITDTSPELAGNLDLGGNNIVGTGNINIDGTITATGDINLGNGAEDNVIVGGQIESNLIPGDDKIYDLGDATARWRSGFFEGLDVDGEIVSLSLRTDDIYKIDSTVLFSGENDLFNANVKGSIINQDDVTIVDAVNNSAVFENLEADNIFGSIYNDDSTLMLDNRASIINVETVIAAQLESPSIIPPDNQVLIFSEDSTSPVGVTVQSQDENSGDLRLLSQSLTQDLTTNNTIYGRILFERNDINGSLATGVIGAGRDNMFFASDPNGNLAAGDVENFVVLESGNLVIGGLSPNHKLDVRGEAVIESYVQFGSLTTTERNALLPENGMVIYNSTDSKFQGYQNGAWINLDDGTAA